MRFLADMGIGGRVVQWLRNHGHDVIHLTDQGLQRLRSGKIFDKGVAENRVILILTSILARSRLWLKGVG